MEEFAAALAKHAAKLNVCGLFAAGKRSQGVVSG
jgi:hypothetical protein